MYFKNYGHDYLSNAEQCVLGLGESGLTQKYTFNKKSTIFAQSLWNFVKMIIWWGQYFDQVSYKLGKNCGFFNKSTFQQVSDFFWTRLYLPRPHVHLCLHLPSRSIPIELMKKAALCESPKPSSHPSSIIALILRSRSNVLVAHSRTYMALKSSMYKTLLYYFIFQTIFYEWQFIL